MTGRAGGDSPCEGHLVSSVTSSPEWRETFQPDMHVVASLLMELLPAVFSV